MEQTNFCCFHPYYWCVLQKQTYALWQETERMRRRKAELHLELAKLKHLNSLDEVLEIQVSYRDFCIAVVSS